MKANKNKATTQDYINDTRIGGTVDDFKWHFLTSLFYTYGRFPEVASKNDLYLSLASTVRDKLIHKLLNTSYTYFQQASRTVVYLSAEYLLGPHLINNLVNLGQVEKARKAIMELGYDFDELARQEQEPGLGNGGLGRLAACYMESLATLEIPTIGYGIRYEFGIFDQIIRDGWQVEVTDKWLRSGNPWEIPHPDLSRNVGFGGRTVHYTDDRGKYRVRWEPQWTVKGVPHDTPILGYKVNTANMLRLWKAEACESFNLSAFNMGDYYGAVDDKVYSENITKVLYPNDEPAAGKRLRLQQQYFFVSCSLQDMVRLFKQKKPHLDGFDLKFSIQLNDTHPSIAVAELMRILVDEHDHSWESAWDITRKTFAYTNHTLLPEALEKWPLPLFQELLPRHLEIIYEINRRFLNEVSIRFPNEKEKIQRMSIIEEGGDKKVRMANLASIGSFAINGVAELHTRLLEETVLKDFFDMWPEKFSNKTNGVTPRRFMAVANPGMTELISSAIGDEWIKDLSRINSLEKFADDIGFREKWRQVKHSNGNLLAERLKTATGVSLDPASMFDIHVKRIHEYKRQFLNILNVIVFFRRIKEGLAKRPVPRSVIIGGKAAPGYITAKLIIKLINSVADVINNDPDVKGLLKVVFCPDFNVTKAQHIYPAADLSEQISTAGYEASGTSNMKFAMNGALTIGTLDGANVEIMEEVGRDNFFLFGLTAEEVMCRKRDGYKPREIYETDAEVRAVIDMISSGMFSKGDKYLFQPLVNSLLNHDEYMLLADFHSYRECQKDVSAAYRDQERWTKMSILNVARIGKFSSDRAINEYCRDIWHVTPVKVIA